MIPFGNVGLEKVGILPSPKVGGIAVSRAGTAGTRAWAVVVCAAVAESIFGMALNISSI